MGRLIHSVDALSIRPKNYRDATSTIRELIGREGVRLLGRALDRKK